MTDAQRLILKDHFLLGYKYASEGMDWYSLVEDNLNYIESVLIQPTPSIPTHDGNSVAGVSAEWDLAESVLGKCTCNVAYVSRRMADPDCAWCEYHVDMIESIRSVCADKDREILHLNDVIKSAQAEVERLKWEKELMLRSNTRWTEKAKQLESELAESKRRVAELEQNAPKLVLPSVEEMRKYLNGYFGFGGDPSISDREYGFEHGYDYTIDEIKRLNGI